MKSVSTRRAMLGAAILMPIAAATAGAAIVAPAASRGAWNRALAKHAAARAAYEKAMAAHNAEEELCYADPTREKSREDALYEAMRPVLLADSQAIDDLLETPAPDFAAVIYKIQLAESEGLDCAHLDPVVADIRRLSGEA